MMAAGIIDHMVMFRTSQENYELIIRILTITKEFE
jgi:hypothetical protein